MSSRPAPSAAATAPPSGAAPSPSAHRADAGDYGWFEAGSELTEGFCFTWVAGRSPGRVVRALGGRRLGTTGWPSDWTSFSGRRGGETVMAVAGVRGWALIVEDNGILALRDDLLRRLSAGTTVVTHFRNVEYDSRFALIKDGHVQVAFDPYDPDDRTGSRPDVLLTEMRAGGFAVGGQDREDPDATARTFALTEQLTGVPMTPGLLHSASYVLLALYDADRAAWERENPDPRLQPGQ